MMRSETSLAARQLVRGVALDRADHVRVERAGEAAIARDDDDRPRCAARAPRTAGARPCRRPPASSDTTFASACEYGRAAMIASCARRSFAAATSFMARVIFRVFFTLTIRLRIALRLGISLLLLVDRELLRELGQRVAQPLLEVALELAGALELGEDVGLARLDERQQLASRSAAARATG